MTPPTMTARPWLLALVLLLAPGLAEAHIIAARLGDFYTGALHPLTDPQDIVLWLALALFAGSLGPGRARWLVLLMPLGLLAGFLLQVTLGIGQIGALGAAGLMVGLGLLLASGLATGLAAGNRLFGGAVLLVTATSGASNAAGMAPEANATLFAAGLASAGYVVITLLLAAIVALRWPSTDTSGTAGWRAIVLRVCGSWIAAIGLMIGGFALKSLAGV